jgi:ParB-like chromosome segregation protein Spo0J
MTASVTPVTRARALSELHVSPDNPRTISGSRLDALKADLRHDPEMLWARPVIALPDGTVVVGNMRLRAAQELGLGEVPTFTVDLDPVRAREWMLRDNASYGDWVPGLLADTIAQAVHEQVPTEHFGFTA